MQITPSLHPFLVKNLDFKEADYVLFGAPLDKTTSNRRGTRFAPINIRKASENIDTYSIRTGLDWDDLKLSDIGDVFCPDVETSLNEIVEAINSIKPKFPVMLGGEHTITLGALRALKPQLVIIFDAHLDLRDELFGEKLCHATYLRRSIEELDFIVVVIGARALSKEEVKYAESEDRITFLSSKGIIKEGVEESIRYLNELLDSVETAYLSIDMDVLDPSFAPGVSNPHPEGISTTQLIDIIQGIMKRKFVGMDLNEVSPLYDQGVTAILAGYITVETLLIHLSC
jgi:agmatinase